MTTTPTRPRNAIGHLDTEGNIVAYLEAAFNDGSPGPIAATLGDVTKAEGMIKIVKAGLGRESLYKAISPDGNPGFTTVLKVLHALELRLHESLAQHAGPLDRVESSGTAALVPDS